MEVRVGTVEASNTEPRAKREGPEVCRWAFAPEIGARVVP